MTGNYKDKFSAVVMATLMVLSVVAIGGAALAGSAAASNHSDLSVEQGPVSYEDSNGNALIEIVFDGSPSEFTADEIAITDRNGDDVPVEDADLTATDNRLEIALSEALAPGATLGSSVKTSTTSSRLP
ncbi:surface glycoprotein [Saliphagus sp. GCM10025308]